MKIKLLDPVDGRVINEFGTGTVLSLAERGTYLIAAVPDDGIEAASVVISINGADFTLTEEPFIISAGQDESSDFKLSTGSLTISANGYATTTATGPVIDGINAVGEVITGVAEPTAGSGDGPTIISSEFDQEAEAEAEAEAEVEAEAAGRAAGGSVGLAAAAAAVGSNALTQTLTSGSMAIGVNGINEANESPGEGNSTTIQPNGGATAPAGEQDDLSDTINADAVVAEGEAEVEVEAEAEVEVSGGAAAATAGVAAAAAAVGSQSLADRVDLSDVATAIDGASATSVATADNPGQSADLGGRPGLSLGAQQVEVTTVGESDRGTGNSTRTNASTDGVAFGEAEVEVEAEAEAEAEAGIGVAAAAATGASGVAVVGDFATGASRTSSGTATSASTVTLRNPDVAALTTSPSGQMSSISVDGTALVDGSAFDVPDGSGTTGPTTTNSSEADDTQAEAEAEAEAEVEVEAEVGNNAAAVAVAATAGAGAAGLRATTLTAGSSAGSVSTEDHSGTFTRNNDVVQIDADLSDSDIAPASETEATAEADAEAEATAAAGSPAFGNDASSAGTGAEASGDSTAISQVELGGDAENGSSQGITQIDERVIDDLSGEFTAPGISPRTGASAGQETEFEAEAEAEAEAEVGFNAAAAGAGAAGALALTGNIDTDQAISTSAATSTSVFSQGDATTREDDLAGPEGTNSNATFEIETEAEAEAEVGFGAGAAAAAAGAAGYDGIDSETASLATTNAAVAAAASGREVRVFVSTPSTGTAGSIYAYAAAWDDQGGGVAAAIALAGTPLSDGTDNEFEIEAEGEFSVVLEYTLETAAFDPTFIPDLNDGGNAETGAEGSDGSLRGAGEAEVEAEAEAEAGYGVAAAAASTAAVGYAATTSTSVATATTSTEFVYGTVREGNNAANTLRGSDASDILIGRGGADNLRGGAGADLLNGGNGNDVLRGGSGDDNLIGGAGSDRLIDSLGRDFFDGGAGRDIVVSFDGFDMISGGAGADILVGGLGDDALVGGAGNDLLRADQSDLLYGNDVLSGGTGDDLLEGGAGADTFIFKPQEDRDTIAQFEYGGLRPDQIGADFDPRIDVIELRGFGYDTYSDLLRHMTDVEDDIVFQDQGTTIVIAGVSVADLSSDNFSLA